MEHLSYAGAHADFLAADAEGAHVPATFQPDPPEKRVYPSKSGIPAGINVDPVAGILGGLESQLQHEFSRTPRIVFGSAFGEVANDL